ncbi:MAG: sodium:solute symporter family protein [Deltaproteobacteria bacterium]|nr:sodium:solute symporter family protein [Deltaproteobacteria bacterium]
MTLYLWLILGYLVVLMALNFIRARRVKSQEDFMVAGRTLSVPVMVFTLVCTWIGSGTFIAGAEYAYRAGLSSLWMPAGAWIGIAVIYFLAGRIRTFGQYTIGDILDQRYGRAARVIGAVALVISFVTIVSYQFKAGGLILNVLTQRPGGASYVTLKGPAGEQRVRAVEVKRFKDPGRLYYVRQGATPIESVATAAIKSKTRTGDLTRIETAGGTILAARTSSELIEFKPTAGGAAQRSSVLAVKGVDLDSLISADLGQLITALLVILFTALGGMIAVAYTDLPNGIIIVLACVLALPFLYLSAGGWSGIHPGGAHPLPPEHFAAFNPDFGRYPIVKALGYALSTMLLLMGIQSMYQKFYSAKTAAAARSAVLFWIIGTIIVETVVVFIAVFGNALMPNVWDARTIVIEAARSPYVPRIVGFLLLAAACAVVLSTAMNYLLSPTTNLIRDIYQSLMGRQADEKKVVWMQKGFVVLLGALAWLMATQSSSVLETSYLAYTLYGAAITPALLAALAWRRATRQGGLWSIVLGTVVVGVQGAAQMVCQKVAPQHVIDGDLLGVPILYPGLVVSVATLVIVSLLTPPPTPEELKGLLPEQPAT